MFWRFGFHNGSSIDSLLDKDDIVLEAILDEDDLLQECKAQNTRLIDYFQRVDVLQRLFGYVTGQIEVDPEMERGRYKYPYVATEVLCSEIWSIVETCTEQQAQLLLPFWETVLDRPPEDMKTQMVMASHFAKINAVFMTKKPVEMLAFIQSQPSIIERMLRHVETPSFVDLLIRIIQLDEQQSGIGVIEWLSSENLMGRLVDMLSPSHSSDIHTLVSELIKNIISMATASPTTGINEGLPPASNRFAREVADRANVSKLVGYMVTKFDPPPDRQDFSDSENPTYPNHHSSLSSVINSISVVIELIRKNNSDYFEPYLFHTLRTRLIQVQQQLHTQDGREALENAMKEMVDRMGVVHLGPLLDVMCQQLSTFQLFLREPRSLRGPLPTTVGPVIPLTFERYRICELFAELLHCSNMSLLNRSAEYDHIYDSQGRLQGGLSALEELARVIAQTSGEEDNDSMDQREDNLDSSSHDLPVTNSSHDATSSIDSDEDMSDHEPGSSDDEAMEEIAMFDDPTSHPVDSASSASGSSSSLPEVAIPEPLAGSSSPFGTDSTTLLRSSQVSRRSSRRAVLPEPATPTAAPVGERLKQCFLSMNILSNLFDLFFEFPWNNFLHGTVYDMAHQILTGNIDKPLNRELVIALFRDARLMHRIVDGQRNNDIECSKPKGVRLGYMGHLTLISEDVVVAFERLPPDLRTTLQQYAPQPAWDEYISGGYHETKKRDAQVLGGGKPTIVPGAYGAGRGSTGWKVDEADISPTGAVNGTSPGNAEPRGEFKRTASIRPNSADFGPAPAKEDDDDAGNSPAPHFARYLAFEMQSSNHFESDDDDDDDGGWLSHSTTFELGDPPVSARNHSTVRKPLTSGFDDVFDPGEDSAGDPFTSEADGAFGPFSTSNASGSTAAAESFDFSNSFSDEMIDDASFDGFGDFGDFQSAGGDSADDGELTPTTGSWTFESGSITSDAAAAAAAASEGSNIDTTHSKEVAGGPSLQK